jgi:hypothetical protein
MPRRNPNIARLRQHVRDLCKHHRITVYRCRRSQQACAQRESKQIAIPPIKSAKTYATAMHELGHVLGHHQDSRRVMVRERWAWNWARANALTWPPNIERVVARDLTWYAAHAAKLDRRAAQQD